MALFMETTRGKGKHGMFSVMKRMYGKMYQLTTALKIVRAVVFHRTPRSSLQIPSNVFDKGAPHAQDHLGILEGDNAGNDDTGFCSSFDQEFGLFDDVLTGLSESCHVKDEFGVDSLTKIESPSTASSQSTDAEDNYHLFLKYEGDWTGLYPKDQLFKSHGQLEKLGCAAGGSKAPGKKRGRKPLHPRGQTAEEDISMKRKRNNEASKKFRQSRKHWEKSLFEVEKRLLEENAIYKSKVDELTVQIYHFQVLLKGRDHKEDNRTSSA